MLFLVVYGAPAHLKAFALPSACTAYSNVDGQGINIGMASVLTPNRHHRVLVQQQHAHMSTTTQWRLPALEHATYSRLLPLGALQPEHARS